MLLIMLLLLPVMSHAEEVISWHQKPCQFVEAEGKNRHYQTQRAEDCRRINQRSGEQRLQHSKVMHLKAGDYVFRIYNDNVPYELGFWLRGAGLDRLLLPSVSGGGIKMGTYRDYPIHLKAGHYRYSCPLNPTPDYTLEVTP